ncbi:MAG: deoxyribose-phosphate aldolase [Planctomycetota bacterium]
MSRYDDIAQMIDHAVLKPDATSADMLAGCDLVKAYGCASCCVMPHFAAEAAERLTGSSSVACVVIGFPHGSSRTAAKVAEATEAARDGAAELDFVVNVSRTKTGDWSFVADDIRAVTEAGHAEGAKIKAIFECCYLTDDEKRRLCQLSSEAGVDWVKTSTGFGVPPDGVAVGATDEDLRLMRDACPPTVQVKASGGVRTLERAELVRSIGCSRIGTSSTSAILDPLCQQLDLPPIQVATSSDARY